MQIAQNNINYTFTHPQVQQTHNNDVFDLKATSLVAYKILKYNRLIPTNMIIANKRNDNDPKG